MRNRDNWYLDHCILVLKSNDNSSSRVTLEHRLGNYYKIRIDAIGKSDKVMAFRVKREAITTLCSNKTPYITICTFNGGKPVDSNAITDWKEISPIWVTTTLVRV